MPPPEPLYDSSAFLHLDGPAIRDANRGDSRELIGANRFAEKPYHSQNVRAIRANRLKPSIRNFFLPEARFAKRGSARELSGDSHESPDARESANRFARIGPSKLVS